MSTQAHTPGPWTAHDSVVDAHVPVSAPFGEGRTCVAAARFERWSKNAGGPCRDEAQANARLIAAAPDMLAALGEAIDLIGSAWGGDFNPDDGECAELCPASDCQNLGCVSGKISRIIAAFNRATDTSEGRS